MGKIIERVRQREQERADRLLEEMRQEVRHELLTRRDETVAKVLEYIWDEREARAKTRWWQFWK
jgi:Mg/Co/Ni transporter MgtE